MLFSDKLKEASGYNLILYTPTEDTPIAATHNKMKHFIHYYYKP